MGLPLSLYLHLPFCQSRCSYCDFNAYAGLEELRTPYSRALAQEIRLVGGRPGRAADLGPAHTIFLGGGTPSLTPLAELADILAACREAFDVAPEAEISLEANPGTVSPEYLAGLRELGVNRLSLGAQSAHAAELRLFNRIHTFAQAAEAVRWARAAGFDNLNLDLIYGIPGQTLERWRHTLAETLRLEPDHLSAYALSLEFDTPMHAWVQRGLLAEPDSDLAATMYEWAAATLEAHGYAQYEISNWAKAGQGVDRRCRHNLQYWRNLPYLGLGAGAHGYAQGWRYSVVRSPRGYIERVAAGPGALGFPFSPALAERHAVDREAEMGETLMLGMRLVDEGVTNAGFSERFGVGLADRFGRQLGRLQEQRLIGWDGATARLTRPGRLLANRVFREFI